MDQRSHNLARLRGEPLDVLIIGGGINGAGVARDLALRSARAATKLRVGLVEQRHFASGTSGKNSQLIHGGLRYLKTFEFGLVAEALHERSTLLELAPHLVQPQPFLIPMYGWFDVLLYSTGLRIYDLLAGKRSIGRHRGLSTGSMAEIEPGLAREHLRRGAVFFDARVHSARFVLENVLDATRAGVAVANYARAEVAAGAVRLTDTLSGEAFDVRPRKIVDATGPWERTGVRLVRGSHIVIPRVNQSENAIAYFEPSGRIVFVIPWGSRRDLSLVGTTDVDHTGSPDDVHISQQEVEYLASTVKRLFPRMGDVRVISTFSSLRPLVADGAASATKASRGHRIWNDADRVLHISGGKYTTYRAMSEEAADLVCVEIAPQLRYLHFTAATPLNGNSRERVEALLAAAPDEESRQLVREYGVAADAVLAGKPAADGGPLTPLQRARIAYAVRHEMARRIEDVMYVSTYWGYEREWTEESLRPYVDAMAACSS